MSSWSDIRLRSDDPLASAINDLIIKSNQSQAITEQITVNDKISPIRLFSSKVEISDTAMFSGYVRTPMSTTSFFQPLEPDGKKVRIDCRFDSGGDKLFDYSYMNNDINIGYNTNFPVLMKATEDDGVTAGTIVSLLDGQQHYYYIPTNPKNSIKQMIADGETGISFVYRVYPLTLSNEQLSGNTKRANLVNFIENDQVDYAVKVEMSDTAIIHFYVKYLTNTYYIATTAQQIGSILPPGYFTPDYEPADYDTLSTAPITLPIAYVDLGFTFNFSTKAMQIFNNGVLQSSTTVTTAPASTFPASFTDPAPPPPTPVPYTKPFTTVMNQQTSDSTVKINAITTSNQIPVYNVPSGVATTDPQVLVYDILPGTVSAATPLTTVGGIATTDQSFIPMCKDTSNTNNVAKVGVMIVNIVSTNNLGQKMRNQPITQCTFSLTGTSGVTGTVYCRIWDANGNVAHTMGSVAAGTFDNTAVDIQFQDTANTTVMAVGWIIGVEYTTGNTADIIKVQRSGTDVDTSIVQAVQKPGSSTWGQNTTYDVKCDFKSGTGGGGGDPVYTLSNITNNAFIVGEFFGSGSPMIGNIVTLIQFMVWRDTTATAGTIYIKHKASDFSDKAILYTGNVTSLPTTQPASNYNFVWQNVDYGNSIQAGDILAIEISGVSAGLVKIMTNLGNVSGNDYDGVRSSFAYKNVGATSGFVNTATDVNGRLSIGGSSFTGFISLDDIRKRTGERLSTASSSLIGNKLTKVTVVLKKFNNPALAPVYCRVRDSAGNIKVTMGQIDMNGIFATNTSVDFINRANTYALTINDSVSIEYDLGTSTDFLLVQINKGQFEAENTNLFESLAASINTATPIINRDLSATFFTGGVTDLTARPVKGIKINPGSVLIGQSITELDCMMKVTGGFSTGHTIFVYVIRGTDKVVVANIANIEASSISTSSFVNVYFQNVGNSYPLAAGDMIAIQFNNGDSFANFLEVKISSSNTFDGSNTCMFDYDGNTTFNDNPNTDLTGSLLTGGYTVFPDPVNPAPPIPYHWIHGWYLGAAIPADSGALKDPATLLPPQYTLSNNISKQFRLYSMVLTPQQLLNYYTNKLSVSAIAFGYVEVVGHDSVPYNTAL